MNLISKNEFIKFLIDENALRFGSFTLKAGGKSPFFFNLGNVSSGRAFRFLGQAFAEHIQKFFGSAQILFGPPYKAISLVTAAAMAYEQLYGKMIYTLYNRKEEKVHGEKGLFIGRTPKESDRIIVIDDVLTTGGTKMEAIDLVESAFDVKVSGILVCVDRRIKGANSGLGNYPFKAIVALPDIISYLISIKSSQAAVIEDFYEGKT